MNLGKQYGDAQKIAQVASGLKRTNGTSGPLVQRNPVGRPATGQAAPPQQVSDDHQAMMAELADAEVVRQLWAQLAQSSPTPYILGMQQMANDAYDEIATAFYEATPNFE